MEKVEYWAKVSDLEDYVTSHDAPQSKGLRRNLTACLLRIKEASVIGQGQVNEGTRADSAHKKQYFTNNTDDLFKCLRPLLQFGRVLGILPISGLFLDEDLESTVKYSKQSLAGITSIVVVICLVLHTGIRVVLASSLFRAGGVTNTIQIAENVASVVFAIIGAYVYGVLFILIELYKYYFMYSNAPKLISCLHEWRHYKSLVPHLHDHQLRKHVNIIAGTLFTSAILQNVVTHWNILPSSKVTTSQQMSVLEVYYQKHFPKYSDLIPYNPILTVSLFICDKLVVYAWTFGDILVALFARTVYKQFQLHAEVLKRDILILVQTGENAWVKVLQEHENIVELLVQFNDFLRPLILALVSSNIYFIAISLNRFLVSSSSSPSPSVEKPYIVLLQQVNSVWYFIQLLAKTMTTILCCARVNQYAHELEEILWKCPVSSFTKEVERTEQKLRAVKIGFSGMDYFTITKPFILTFFNVIFTFEIVLLQSAGVKTEE